MAYLVAEPQLLWGAAADMAELGSAIRAANVAAAAADEVSTAIANLFSAHGRHYQAAAAQAVEFHDRFANSLAAACKAYASADTDNAAAMSATLNAITAPAQIGSVAGGASGATAETSGAAASNPLAALSAAAPAAAATASVVSLDAFVANLQAGAVDITTVLNTVSTAYANLLPTTHLTTAMLGPVQILDFISKAVDSAGSTAIFLTNLLGINVVPLICALPA